MPADAPLNPIETPGMLAKKPDKKNVLRERLETLWEKGVGFFNGRNTREKVLFIALAVCAAVFLDYWTLIHPIVRVFNVTLPQLSLLEGDSRSYRTDQDNKEKIRSSWVSAKEKISELERRFVAPDELPALLENLSKLALESKVKILSLKTGDPEEAGTSQRYTSVPVKISAVAGTHELGDFLSRLESGLTYFKVLDLKITTQQSEPKRHQVDLVLQVYRRAA